MYLKNFYKVFKTSSKWPKLIKKSYHCSDRAQKRLTSENKAQRPLKTCFPPNQPSGRTAPSRNNVLIFRQNSEGNYVNVKLDLPKGFACFPSPSTVFGKGSGPQGLLFGTAGDWYKGNFAQRFCMKEFDNGNDRVPSKDSVFEQCRRFHAEHRNEEMWRFLSTEVSTRNNSKHDFDMLFTTKANKPDPSGIFTHPPQTVLDNQNEGDRSHNLSCLSRNQMLSGTVSLSSHIPNIFTDVQEKLLGNKKDQAKECFKRAFQSAFGINDNKKDCDIFITGKELGNRLHFGYFSDLIGNYFGLSCYSSIHVLPGHYENLCLSEAMDKATVFIFVFPDNEELDQLSLHHVEAAAECLNMKEPGHYSLVVVQDKDVPIPISLKFMKTQKISGFDVWKKSKKDTREFNQLLMELFNAMVKPVVSHTGSHAVNHCCPQN